jgi:hypothetical protein
MRRGGKKTGAKRQVAVKQPGDDELWNMVDSLIITAEYKPPQSAVHPT